MDLINETNRLYGVLNHHLADREFIADEYSIADDDEARKILFGQTAASLHNNA